MQANLEKMNGFRTFRSEKVHLDEIAVSLSSHLREPSDVMSLVPAGLIACRAGMAPI